MSIHKEGHKILITTALVLFVLNVVSYWYFIPRDAYIATGASFFIFVLILQFFRNPDRIMPEEENAILSPADGSIVVLEKTRETEYFDDDRIQVSIFMSPLNVHLNRVPLSGKVVYQKYHPGKYLVAWHPKSSILNERNTLVLQTRSDKKVLLRQIAGFVARRIVCYKQKESEISQGEELGFIKFGSRVDLFLPDECLLNVEIDQEVKGGQSVIAYFPDSK